MMEEVLKFLKENPVFYMATVEKDQPRVRPFGAVTSFEGRLYICTNNRKDVFAQITENPKVEICGVDQKNGWLRVEARAVIDDRKAAKAAMLNDNPGLRGMYQEDDDIFEVLYLADATATFSSFTDAPRTIRF
jgi:uncharacterized pyridoxamine 5'-phosphate oxidase family protein